MIIRRGVFDGIFRYAYHRQRIELIEFFSLYSFIIIYIGGVDL